LAKPELFLEREGYGEKWHFSLHASGKWHMKLHGQKSIMWDRPGELVPGYVRAVGIIQPAAVAHREEDFPTDTVSVAVSSDSDPTAFSIFIESPVANMNSWPGKNSMGTAFIGRIPLAANEGTCCIVANQEPVRLNPAQFRIPSDVDLRQMRELAVEGVLATTIVGDMSDGAIAMLDALVDPSVVAVIDDVLRR
jgi:hypothetical protein